MYEIIKTGRPFPTKSVLLILVALSILLQIHTSILYKISKRDIVSEEEQNTVPKFCQITQHVQQLREHRNTSHINPAENLVHELYDIMTFSVSSVCPKQKESRYLAMILINSARHHFTERQLIRQTWGSITKYRDWQVHTVFY